MKGITIVPLLFTSITMHKYQLLRERPEYACLYNWIGEVMETKIAVGRNYPIVII